MGAKPFGESDNDEHPGFSMFVKSNSSSTPAKSTEMYVRTLETHGLFTVAKNDAPDALKPQTWISQVAGSAKN